MSCEGNDYPLNENDNEIPILLIDTSTHVFEIFILVNRAKHPFINYIQKLMFRLAGRKSIRNDIKPYAQN